MAATKSKKQRSSANPVRNKATPVERAYARAVQLSRQTGKEVRFVVDIGPDGAETVTGFEEGSASYAGPSQREARHSELGRALADARRRGQLRVAEILAGPEMLSADAFAARLGTTRATVTAWRHKHQVLGLEGATRGFRFPDWQVGPDGKPFRALPQLFDRLGEAWAVYRFLVQHHPELRGMTGREALQKGRVKAVIEAAESVAQAFA
jgi:DNA-binding transcriptional regulator YiaG